MCLPMMGSLRSLGVQPRAMMAWLALLALAFHSLLPLAYHSLQRRQAAIAGFDSIVICTPYGMRTVQIGADGQPLADQDDPGTSKDKQSARYCPICLGAQQAGFAILPASIVIALPVLLAQVLYPIQPQAPPDDAARHFAKARAPPAAF